MKNSLHRYSREKNNYIHKQQTNYFIDVEKTILLRSVSNGNIFVCIPKRQTLRISNQQTNSLHRILEKKSSLHRYTKIDCLQR